MITTSVPIKNSGIRFKLNIIDDKPLELSHYQRVFDSIGPRIEISIIHNKEDLLEEFNNDDNFSFRFYIVDLNLKDDIEDADEGIKEGLEVLDLIRNVESTDKIIVCSGLAREYSKILFEEKQIKKEKIIAKGSQSLQKIKELLRQDIEKIIFKTCYSTICIHDSKITGIYNLLDSEKSKHDSNFNLNDREKDFLIRNLLENHREGGTFWNLGKNILNIEIVNGERKSEWYHNITRFIPYGSQTARGLILPFDQFELFIFEPYDLRNIIKGDFFIKLSNLPLDGKAIVEYFIGYVLAEFIVYKTIELDVAISMLHLFSSPKTLKNFILHLWTESAKRSGVKESYNLVNKIFNKDFIQIYNMMYCIVKKIDARNHTADVNIKLVNNPQKEIPCTFDLNKLNNAGFAHPNRAFKLYSFWDFKAQEEKAFYQPILPSTYSRV